MDLQLLARLVRCCDYIHFDMVYKAVFLITFLAPHSIASFDAWMHITAGDIIFTSNFVKVILKWSKTIQNREKILPHLTPLHMPPLSNQSGFELATSHRFKNM